MDIIRRTIEGLLTPTGFPRSLFLATYDDTTLSADSDVEIIIQGLLGSFPNLSTNAAKNHLIERMHENWTWKVILKTLLVLHRVLVTPRATVLWVRNLGLDDVLESIVGFREGEGYDVQASAHAPILRRYSYYLTELISNIKSEKFDRDRKIDSNMFKDLDHYELFKEIKTYSDNFKLCLSPLILKSQIVPIHGLCPLTAQLSILILKDCLYLYTLLSEAALELVDRFEILHPDDVNRASICYTTYQSCHGIKSYILMLPIDDLEILREFVKRLPTIRGLTLPYFQSLPPLVTLKSINNFTESKVPDFKDKKSVYTLIDENKNLDFLDLTKNNKKSDILNLTKEENVKEATGNIVSKSTNIISQIPLPEYPHPTHLKLQKTGITFIVAQKSSSILTEQENIDWLDTLDDKQNYVSKRLSLEDLL